MAKEIGKNEIVTSTIYEREMEDLDFFNGAYGAPRCLQNRE